MKTVEEIDEERKLGGSTDWELWRFYQSRVDEVRSTLWTHGTWLVALMTALFAFAYEADILQFASAAPGLRVDKPWVALAVAILGASVAYLSLRVVDDHSKHLAENWTYVDYVKYLAKAQHEPSNADRSLPEEKSKPSKRIPLIFISWAFLGGYAVLFVLSILTLFQSTKA